MYNNPYYPQMNNQNNLDQNYINMLDREKERIEKMREQYLNRVHQPAPQPTNLTQNFQLAPTNRDVIKYAVSIEEVQREMVVGDTPYFSKDMSVVWIKNTKGEITTYELTEIVPKDEKDLTIEMLQAQIEELKGKIENDANVTNAVAEQDTTSTTTNDTTARTTSKKTESTRVSKNTRSKKE